MKQLTLFAALICAGMVACAESVNPDESVSVPDIRFDLTTGTLNLPAVDDTYILDTDPNETHGSASQLRMRKSDNRRALLEFDYTSLESAISGILRTEVTAELQLSVADIELNTSAQVTVEARRMTQNWTESGATWNCAIDSNPMNTTADCSGDAWDMDGPTYPYENYKSATLVVDSEATTDLQFDLSTDVVFHLNGVSNHGWLLKMGYTAEAERVTVYAEENSEDPNLHVAYSERDDAFGFNRLDDSGTKALAVTFASGTTTWNVKGQAIVISGLTNQTLDASAISLGSTTTFTPNGSTCNLGVCTHKVAPAVFGHDDPSDFTSSEIYLLKIWKYGESESTAALLISLPFALPDTISSPESESSEEGLWVLELELMELEPSSYDEVILEYSDFSPLDTARKRRHRCKGETWAWWYEEDSFTTLGGGLIKLTSGILSPIGLGLPGPAPYVYISPYISPEETNISYYIYPGEGETPGTIWTEEISIVDRKAESYYDETISNEGMGEPGYPLPTY